MLCKNRTTAEWKIRGKDKKGDEENGKAYYFMAIKG